MKVILQRPALVLQYVDDPETFVGLDSASGGYPYRTRLLYGTHVWPDVVAALKYKRDMSSYIEGTVRLVEIRAIEVEPLIEAST